MLKVSKLLLAGSAAALMLASFAGCTHNPGRDKPVKGNDGLIVPYSGEDKLGTVSGNLLDDGDADGFESEDVKSIAINTEGITLSVLEGEGRTGNCYKVVQEKSTEWNEFVLDLTTLYGQGKSFFISAWVKADPSVTDEDKRFAIFQASGSLYNGAIKNWADSDPDKEYYDYDNEIPGEDPWGMDFSESPVFGDYAEAVTSTEFALSDDWQEISFIVASTDIEKKVNDSGNYVFQISLFAGNNASSGYSYLIDDVQVIDLNTEVLRRGRTWEDPNPPADDDSDADLDDEE